MPVTLYILERRRRGEEKEEREEEQANFCLFSWADRTLDLCMDSTMLFILTTLPALFSFFSVLPV
jgi:hypothetical protein